MEDIKMWMAGVFICGMVMPWIIKASVAAVKDRFGSALDKSLALEKVKDPVLRGKLEHVSLAVVDVLEYITPDSGMGREKFDRADALLASIPLLKGLPSVRASLVEWACQVMWAADDEMKKRLPGVDDHKP